ncbi:PP0621 family protein [Janthinobacterium sp.]|uniref:PP0621 family protein n=1 Tax=Janthinobacterium sp. TaxID=1871054 RepID=UPI00293D9EB6|nr:PP0621 family protein [Janthinobacterium sp.]
MMEAEAAPAAPSTSKPRASSAAPRAAAPADAEAMLCCAQCGVYYPASETVQAKGRDFCSQAHASFP